MPLFESGKPEGQPLVRPITPVDFRHFAAPTDTLSGMSSSEEIGGHRTYYGPVLPVEMA